MKRITWPIILGLTLLAGCQNTEPKEETKASSEQRQQKSSTNMESNTTFPYPNLLSETDQSYSLLVIGEQSDDQPIEKNKKVTEKVNDILSLPELEMSQQAYPELNIETEPAFILFDQTGVVYQGETLRELTTFLENNEPK